MNYNVDEKGYYGDFGGAFIPEMLYPNVAELRENYLKITAEPSFKKEFDELLKAYVGRPTPLCTLPSVYRNGTIPKSTSSARTFVTLVHTRSTIPLVKFFWQNAWAKTALSQRRGQDNTV